MTTPGVDAARATLARAATFWAGRAAATPVTWEAGPADDTRARYTANCFRELDGFLRLLLDELAPVAASTRRNTANRLAQRQGLTTESVRLRAIGRSTACLFHCAGWVRRPDEPAGGWMTAGWPAAGGALRRYTIGDRLRPDSGDVADVCGFFLRMGDTVAG